MSLMLSLLFAASLATTPHPEMLVTTQWLANNIAQPNVIVLDVATLDEFKQGHIDGAVLLNVRQLMVRRANIPDELPSITRLETLFRDAGVKPSATIVLTSNDPLYATRAFFTLDYLGWGDHAAVLDGGNVKWAAEKRPLSTRQVAAKKGDFKAIVNPNALITRDELKGLLASNEPFVLLDARNTNNFLGHQKGAEVEHAGHIPTAQCLPWTANTTVDHGVRTLRVTGELADTYAALIKSADERVVLYCRTGVEASMNYFVLRYLGFHPALYDGSYVEWNKTEPIVGESR
ncbi:MAG TPA: rhodanese-like domain-containing protein [Thermoanaerobaculia bacterium]|nr:rhodanese-like domain-containing protein [Thermoanaerobaculia bacterium]